MANPVAPFGFKIYRHGTGGTPARANHYRIVAAYNAAIFQGDLVTQAADGTIAVAAEGGKFVGIFAGVQYTAPDGSIVYKNNWVASTATKSGTLINALVYDDPNALYLVQTSGTVAAADIGQFVDMDNATAGNATTGISGQAIENGGSGAMFRVVDVLDTWHQYPVRNAAGNPDFAAAGANAYVVVRPLYHQLSSDVATAAEI